MSIFENSSKSSFHAIMMADRDTINIELPASRFQPPLPLVTSFTRSSFHMFNFGKHRCHPNPNQPNPPQDTLTHSMVMSSLCGCVPGSSPIYLLVPNNPHCLLTLKSSSCISSHMPPTAQSCTHLLPSLLSSSSSD